MNALARTIAAIVLIGMCLAGSTSGRISDRVAIVLMAVTLAGYVAAEPGKADQ